MLSEYMAHMAEGEFRRVPELIAEEKKEEPNEEAPCCQSTTVNNRSEHSPKSQRVGQVVCIVPFRMIFVSAITNIQPYPTELAIPDVIEFTYIECIASIRSLQTVHFKLVI